MTAAIRRASRVVLVDEARTHVLLVLGFDPVAPDEPFWFTVGGALDPDEDERAAAVRETREEVGLDVHPEAFAGPFGRERIQFSFDGQVVEQEQAFYVAVVPRVAARFHGVDSVEVGTTLGVRWVPIDELTRLAEPLRPAHLGDVIEQWRSAAPPAIG